MRVARLIRVLAILMMLLALPVWADAKVGDLDGTAGPTLRGVATPGFGGSAQIESAWVVDWEQVEALVDQGDWQSALTLYQDIKWRSEGKDHLRALEGVATMMDRLGQVDGALQAYRALLNALPADSPKRSEMMAKMLVLSEAPAQRVLARQLVPLMVNGDAWAAWGIEQAVITEAVNTLSVTETYGLPYAEDLKARLAAWHTDSARREAMAARLGMIPGAGMFYLGDWRAGLGGFAVFGLLLVMVVGTSNKRQWGVAVWWWLVLAAVLLSGPGMAADRAKVLAAAEVKAILAR